MEVNQKFKFNVCQLMLRVSFIFIFSMVAFSLNVSRALANNLTIDNFAVNDTNTTTNTITFKSDVTWDNSWRSNTNYDAVWLFMKYSTDAGVTWNHATLSSSGVNPTGFTAPTNFEIIVPEDRAGMFLQRIDFNVGSAAATDLEFVWNYAQDGLSDEEAMAANTINKIFGIEMVYIPQGAFYAGDGNSSSDYRFKQGSADDDPWYIENETSITTTSAASDGYYYQNTGGIGESNSGTTFLIPASYPKGYAATYVMKYELTEGQWVAFFNSLSASAKTNRDITSSTEGGKNSDAVVNRNTVSWDSTTQNAQASTTRSDRPVSYVSWPDVLAYADWAGLRPITELEFEKVARGKDKVAVVNEYVWGTSSYNNAQASEIFPDSDEDGTEQIVDGAANLNNNSLSWTTGDGRVGGDAASQKGPLRVGIFAETSTARSSSGAGYYGNMELSGNLYEMIVTVGRDEGRQFQGTHGDGELTTLSGYEGNATNIDWPGINTIDLNRGVTGTRGAGFRGGDYLSASTREYQTSTRTYAGKDPDTEGKLQRYDAALGIVAGGRLARTAPDF